MGCTGGAAGYIDKVILGNHRYQWPTIKHIYKSEAFDPEGILGKLRSFFPREDLILNTILVRSTESF